MYVGAQGNKPYAGPAPEKTTEGGPNKEDKLSAKENTVASSNTWLLQRKIKQLKKQFRTFDVYTAGPENHLILSDKPSIIDASVVSYDSKGPVQMLNCRAKNRTDDSLIACRHLAYAFAIGGFGLKMNVTKNKSKEPGSKFNAVASIENIQNNSAIKTDQQLEKTPVRCGIPKVAVYFDAEHVGQALYDVWMNKGAGDHASHGKRSQVWLFVTEIHLMAIKLVPTTGSAIKIEWYDPNSTTIVRRAIVLNEEILQQLTLNQFVSIPDQKIYAIDQGKASVLISADAVEVENDSDATVLAALTPSLLYLLMKHGQLNSSSMDSLKTTLLKVRSDKPHELMELLAAKSENGTPGLFMALQNGHQGAVSAYVECIRQLRDIIEPKALKELITAKNGDGTPGLFMALKDGHQEAVRDYVEGIKQLRDIIEPGDIWELLAAKRRNGTPGLFVALQNGHQEAVTAYLEGIKEPGDIIEPEAMKELLAAKREDETPGLFMALQDGYQEAVRAYGEGIKQLGDIIGPEVMKELLATKIENETPGLFMALQNGHHEAVRAYVECINQLRDIFEPEVIRELLAAKKGNGTPGLFMALRNGHQEAVSAYLEGIKQLRDIIEPEVISELLAAKRRNGTSGLCVALENGYRESVSAYIQGIEQFSGIIEPEVIKELLAPVPAWLSSTLNLKT